MSAKISALSAASALDLTEKYPIVQGGATKGATGAQLETALAASAAQAGDVTHIAHLLTPKNIFDIGGIRVLWKIIGADMNSTADQAMTKVGTFTNWHPTAIEAMNHSASCTTAVGGLYSAASKGGTQVVLSTQVFTGLTATLTAAQALTRNGAAAGQLNFSAMFLSLSTPQGSPATADIYVFGIPLS